MYLARWQLSLVGTAEGLPVLAVDRGAFDPASLVEATVVVPEVSYSEL